MSSRLVYGDEVDLLMSSHPPIVLSTSSLLVLSLYLLMLRLFVTKGAWQLSLKEDAFRYGTPVIKYPSQGIPDLLLPLVLISGSLSNSYLSNRRLLRYQLKHAFRPSSRTSFFCNKFEKSRGVTVLTRPPIFFHVYPTGSVAGLVEAVRPTHAWNSPPYP